ncbi:MAG TPA: translation initiation factor IF-2 [Phycisphaerae bacterium]|nr:translation initiation factor IF-2 [Phycisphaerae bacterium]HNU45765.1 translation initiation factor IF-2 [Phycisphaerae bacterium]
MADKMRVHILAKELNVSSKAILDKCRAEGLGDVVKNHMSTLSAGLDATIREWFSEGAHGTVLETAERVDLGKVRVRPRRQRKAAEEDLGGEQAAAAELGIPELEAEGSAVAVAEVPRPGEVPPELVAVPQVVAAEAPAAVAAEAAPALPAPPVVVAEGVALPGTAAATVAEAGVVAEGTAAEAVGEVTPAAPVPPAVVTAAAGAGPQEGDGAPGAVGVVAAPEKPREPVRAAGPQHVPEPARLRGPRVVRYEAPDRNLPIRRPGPAPARRPAAEAPPPSPETPGTEAERAAQRSGRRPRMSPRRAAGRAAEAGERLLEWRDQDLLERRERLKTATGKRIHRRRSEHGGGTAVAAAAPGRDRVVLNEPVHMKDFCAGTGLNFLQLVQVLQREHGIVANINMVLPTEVAELLALQFGIEVEIIPAMSKLDQLKEDFAARPRLREEPRPPVVTILGHVDHGKTSLLDAIRKTRVAAAEDGGITQHIGAWALDTPVGRVTFLDTPGHHAFSAMRARGAQMTDVVVLAVAADDGVMPQTVEAISHAKAAAVPVVVALTKIDLGEQNLMKTYGQLAEHGLTPSGDWGGEVDVIPTSVVSGRGIAELLQHIVALGELLNLRADPSLPATGTVIEAETKEGVGPVVRLLVQEGTLRVGDIVVCGSAFGKVRALLNDRGERIAEAGPATPVEVWGLDDVPMAGDQLFGVDNLQSAKDVATEIQHERVVSARLQTQKVRTLEEMFRRRDVQETPELNLIIKADVDGSLAALRQALSELPSDEVRLTIRHTGVGAVNDSDVLLAATCEGIVVAFRVDSAVGARRLAEEHGVEIRAYRVIYEVADEVKKALEGLLAPEERIEFRGKAEVRNIFHISKVGAVAGSYVLDGVVERSHLAKVIRDGVVVREGCKFASVRRFKDDVKEVRAGLECGLRIEGFEDLHVGDLVETYEVVKIARTL